MFKPIGKLLKDRRGATAVEYGLIIALVVLTAMLAILGVANRTTQIWNNVSDRVTNAA